MNRCKENHAGWLLLGVSLLMAVPASGYPLDGYPNTGISRVEGLRRAQRGSKGAILPPGAELTTDRIVLSLQHRPDFRIPEADPSFSAFLRRTLGRDAASWGLVVLDLSDPQRPVYGEVNPDATMNVGSVGKLIVALGFFQALADIEPDIAKRRVLLRDHRILADEFIRTDTHEVPIYEIGDKKIARGPIEEGEEQSLYTFLDHMLSPSSNAAASLLGREAVLMKEFGARYPRPYEESRAYLDGASRSRLTGQLRSVLQESVSRSGLDRGHLLQGSLFTREGKKRLPGTSSYASARALLEYLVAMEKGELVDAWSSKEIKKLLYVTDKRARWASSPALRDAAVYFKSGSLYKCRPERGYACEKYRGNVWNFLSAVVLVEEPERNPPLRYMAVGISNLLRKDSIAAHEDLATRIQEAMEERHPTRSSAVVED